MGTKGMGEGYTTWERGIGVRDVGRGAGPLRGRRVRRGRHACLGRSGDLNHVAVSRG